MAKDAYYFSHDSNARHDEKMLQLRAVYKGEGYGWYWMLIEMMRDANAYRLQYDGKYTFSAIAKELDCDEQLARQFVDDCIAEFKLFELEGGFFYSSSLLRRMDEVEAKREKARNSANARWNRNANAMRTHSDSNAIKESKVKENKRKDNTPLADKGESEIVLDEPPVALDDEFEWFWDTYGKKRGRPECERTFKKLSLAEKAAIRTHLPEYVASTPQVAYRKDPIRYLSKKSWNDDIIRKELEGSAADHANNGLTHTGLPKLWV